MFSHDIDIRNGDSHSIIKNNSNQRLNWSKAVTIGNHVWVAAHVRILKGSTIADNSVIGNSSLIAGLLDIPNSIYVGTPACKVRSDINWDRSKTKFSK